MALLYTASQNNAYMKIPALMALLTCLACTPRKTTLETALETANSNRPALEKVLKHYAAPADSLKYRAAVFLIANMPAHYGVGGDAVNRYAAVFDQIDTAALLASHLSNEEKSAYGEALLDKYGNPDTTISHHIPDVRQVSAGYLISNIDLAFKAWQEAPWYKKVSFENFCEFILPYRVRDERLEYWRSGLYNEMNFMTPNASDPSNIRSVYDYLNWQLNSETNFNIFFNRYFPFTQSLGDVVKGRIGSCEITSFYATSAMRSAGLPVAFDFIPHWGSTNSSHYMTHLVGDFNTQQLITNENTTKNTWHLVDFSTDIADYRHLFTSAELPSDLYIDYIRTIPKVYRYTFSVDTALAQINQTIPATYICPVFTNTTIRDVTEEYITNTTVTVNLQITAPVAYLCVFDIGGWQPVAISRVNGHQATFTKMGKNVVYLPTIYKNGEHIPAAAPFYLDSLNQQHVFATGNTPQTSLKLIRKFPFYPYTAYHSEILKGARFEAANDTLFTHPVLLGNIDYYPFYMNEIAVNIKNSFRCFRYVAPPNANFEPDNIAEIQFRDAHDSLPLRGKLLGKPGVAGHEINKAFDNNLDSYYQNAENRNGWVGIDLGPGNKARVGSIRFCPRNDTNCILPGYEYELFYWDGHNWVSLGVQIAKGYALYYKAPVNGLYWLRCNSGGREERIFSYKDGKQIWW